MYLKCGCRFESMGCLPLTVYGAAAALRPHNAQTVEKANAQVYTCVHEDLPILLHLRRPFKVRRTFKLRNMSKVGVLRLSRRASIPKSASKSGAKLLRAQRETSGPLPMPSRCPAMLCRCRCRCRAMLLSCAACAMLSHSHPYPIHI